MARSARPSRRSLVVYVAGLTVVFGARLAGPPEWIRIGIVALALGVMVLTYVVDTGSESHPVILLVGGCGIVLGVALALSGRLAGLAFLAGGLLFVNHDGSTGGDRP